MEKPAIGHPGAVPGLSRVGTRDRAATTTVELNQVLGDTLPAPHTGIVPMAQDATVFDPLAPGSTQTAQHVPPQAGVHDCSFNPSPAHQ